MLNLIASQISLLRERLKLTQDQFGARYGVSGPAIFKFEQGSVTPSLELWLKIAYDLGMHESTAVPLYAKAKLPEQFQEHIKVKVENKFMMGVEHYGIKEKVPAYDQITDRAVLRQVVTQDQDLPEGLRQLLLDDDYWVVFKPTGREIFLTVQKFGMFQDAQKELFSDALRYIRQCQKQPVISE